MAQTNPRSKSYPIAETFTSVQGEGIYTGTLMHFIRLAGCNVGRYIQVDAFGGVPAGSIGPDNIHVGDFPLLQSKEHSVCESALGQKFLCDTNYHRTEDVPVEELIRRAANVEHLCITGGEPFLHDLEPLLLASEERMVHIETSGTRPILWTGALTGAWITCSPKAGFLPSNVEMVDEWKFVVASPADIRKVVDFVQLHDIEGEPIYLQPVNWVNAINSGGIDMVLAQLERYPTFRLSAQLHKYLGVR